MLLFLYVVVLGIMAGVWAVARLVLETLLQRYCLMLDTELLPTATSTLAPEAPASEEGVVISMTQYLSLGFLVHTAFLSGVNA